MACEKQGLEDEYCKLLFALCTKTMLYGVEVDKWLDMEQPLEALMVESATVANGTMGGMGPATITPPLELFFRVRLYKVPRRTLDTVAMETLFLEV